MNSNCRATLLPAADFKPVNDCVALRKAMKGLLTDEKILINVLCCRSLSQRLEIVRTYKTSFGEDLSESIQSKTKGDFRQLLLALVVDFPEFYARELHEAVKGSKSKENTLIEIMCTLTNHEIHQVGKKYFEIYDERLEKDLKKVTKNKKSSDFGRLMTSLSVGGRDESGHTDVSEAINDANELKKAGIDKWGTDEVTFNRILCTRNYEQLKLIVKEYQSLTGHSLEDDIKKEFSGHIENGLLVVLRNAVDRPLSYAILLYKSMHGLGTNDKSLVRLVVTRCEFDMVDIKEAFNRKYGKSLLSYINGDTSGDYKVALNTLIGEKA